MSATIHSRLLTSWISKTAIVLLGCTLGAGRDAAQAGPGSGRGNDPGNGNQPQVLRTNGTLDASCPQLRDGSYYRVYKFRLVPGRAFEFRLSSNDFDAFLWIQPEGDISVDRALAKDDDSGGGTNAVIRGNWNGRETDVLIVVNSYRGGESGRFLLEVASVPMQGGQGNPAPRQPDSPLPPPPPPPGY